MKKTLALILALAMALALVACGGNSAPAATEAPKAEAPAAEAPAADNTGAGKTVGIAMPTQSSERWIKDGGNMKAQLEACQGLQRHSAVRRRRRSGSGFSD